MREKIFLMAFFIVLQVLLSSPFTPLAQAGEVIKIGGVGGALGTMKLLGQAFERSHPGIKVIVLPSIGSKGALRAVPEGAIDIGLTGRPLNDEELRRPLSVVEYARTPFIFVTRTGIKADGLTYEELIRIYRGEMQKWPKGERIRIVLHPAGDPVKSLSPEVKRAIGVALTWQGIEHAITDQENLELIEKTPGALGYTTLTQVIAEKRPVKILSLNGVVPGVKTLAEGSYPVSKSLFMVTKQEPDEKVRKFIQFVLSEEGAGILRETGNVVVRNK
jgi:phosphate transport system substrate-binding protein